MTFPSVTVIKMVPGVRKALCTPYTRLKYLWIYKQKCIRENRIVMPVLRPQNKHIRHDDLCVVRYTHAARKSNGSIEIFAT